MIVCVIPFYEITSSCSSGFQYPPPFPRLLWIAGENIFPCQYSLVGIFTDLKLNLQLKAVLRSFCLKRRTYKTAGGRYSFVKYRMACYSTFEFAIGTYYLIELCFLSILFIHSEWLTEDTKRPIIGKFIKKSNKNENFLNMATAF